VASSACLTFGADGTQNTNKHGPNVIQITDRSVRETGRDGQREIWGVDSPERPLPLQDERGRETILGMCGVFFDIFIKITLCIIVVVYRSRSGGGIEALHFEPSLITRGQRGQLPRHYRQPKSIHVHQINNISHKDITLYESIL